MKTSQQTDSKKLLKNRNYSFPVVCYFAWKLELVSNILWMIVKYRQKIKNVFGYENKAFVTHWRAFLSNKRKGKSLREVVIFYLKKIKKVKWETPQKENVVPI